MSEANTILFYTSAQPGALPFVRVPATPEGLRYAGYLARYRGRPFSAMVEQSREYLSNGDSRRDDVAAGYLGYPTNPGIPVGTERFVGDAVWSRMSLPTEEQEAELPGQAWGWTPVPEGAPPPREA